ncbi:MAG: glycosyltransferase [Phycisphaerales bacterium]|nr:glycosyltransferase [Phycisphaerales bacterium]
MPSVIIPAHNEEASIEGVLRAVLADEIADLECVVVANACSDRTAEIARRFEPAITVIETPEGGKCRALNTGEKVLKTFPRVFLDGDIILEKGTLKAILDAVGPDRPIVSPMPRFNLDGASRGIRLFYQAQRFNEYFGDGSPNGSGTFVLSEEGRSRWEEFPEIIADDGFVQGHFLPEERTAVPDAHAVVRPPRDLSSMLEVRARVRRGWAEFNDRFPELMKNHVPRGGSMVRKLLPRPLQWPAMFVYGYVRIGERLIARRQRRRNMDLEWGRDESSRTSDSQD